ncbi:hypothetical protein [Streptomyces marincola]|uniref:Nucleotidyltransferase domain-containing protein n=1 Tax=Streptomyces marincola TaxID=2878388 RepID=A0A1W7CSE9_9ACTN|nr:hypothetical protein [Streptomyces marincola]ARQ67639.1 hypothetical protein CAG99_01270 [Streptomyces marincola]
MRAREARAAAADWIERHGGRLPGFAGAYLGGSTAALPPDAPVPPGSDVDVMVVTEGAAPGAKPGKLRHLGALLDVTLVPADQLASPDAVLSDYHLAPALRANTVVADPAGRLKDLHEDVARRFAEPRWVAAREAHALRRVTDGLRGLDVTAPWPQAVTAWLFPTGVTTHVLLVAALRNPTIRLRYVASRDLLAAHGLARRHEELLELLGSAALTAPRAEQHLRALADTFDAAAAVARTPFAYASDITPAARAVSIDSLYARIRAGQHREVAFWLAATAARCHTVLDADAPEALREERAPHFAALLADLGIASPADLTARAADVLAYLPVLTDTADAVRHAVAGSSS